MLEAVVVSVFGLFTLRTVVTTENAFLPIPKRVSQRLQRLWDIAQSSMKEHKYLRAEKALLTILKLDQTNAAAYNRLGILYSKQKEYKDAIECFEIASSIDKSASSLHNLGLIYLETENFEKAAMAFENAIAIEDNLAARHIAYAKVLERLGNNKKMLEELEKAADLEPNPQTFTLLMKAYENTDNDEAAKEIRRKMQNLIIPSGRTKRIRRPKRVVV